MLVLVTRISGDQRARLIIVSEGTKKTTFGYIGMLRQLTLGCQQISLFIQYFMVIPNYDVLVKSNIVNLSLISDGLVSTQTVLLSILCCTLSSLILCLMYSTREQRLTLNSLIWSVLAKFRCENSDYLSKWNLKFANINEIKNKGNQKVVS